MIRPFSSRYKGAGRRHRFVTDFLHRGAWVCALALAAFGSLAFTPSVQAQNRPVMIAAGGYHSCAVMDTGRPKCWGYNAYGQLGVNDTVNRGDAPGQMGSALPGIFINQVGPIIQMSLGGFHTCALDGVGKVWCWGYNVFGQLGYGNTNNLGDNAGEVNGGTPFVTSGVQKIAAGSYHTCALKFGGVVWCWGYNAFGQLGTGDTQNRRDGVNNAFAIPSLGTGRHAIDITAASYSTCVLLDDQSTKCWGYNGVGTLGAGDTVTRGDGPGEMGDALPAVNLGGFGPVKQLSGGGYHVCATNSGANIKCWGYNVFGQLGLGDTNARGDGPGEMGNTLPFVAGYGNFDWTIVSGLYHNCTHANSGFVGRFAIKCWGYNGYGQLGLGNTDNQGDNPGELDYVLPAAVQIGTDPDGSGLPWSVVGMATGWYHTCVLLTQGKVKCWGYNGLGQLGQGDTVDRGGNPTDMGDGLPAIDLQ